ncbi:DNA-binding MarR family transcriptional regulator [Neobacillus sp. B4I6]|jgi:DNA-binding MarR family transcriptional regulator|uniref:MarR family winged helix-turn-helix transcriptional regulator n=1 Tax=Neobacillus sp. B4I6 TaxID=3373925 RepID=UPI003D19AEBB
MNTNQDFMDYWLSIDSIQNKVKKELENVLQTEYSLSLKEFYVLYYLSKAPDKKLRLQQLQEMIGLSQSALSRLVGSMEANSCGALEKHVCTDDRRGTYTRLTDLGEKKLQRSLVSFREILKSNLSTVNVEGLMKQLIKEL